MEKVTIDDIYASDSLWLKAADLMKDGKVQLVFNTVDGSAALTDSFTLRRTALMHKIAYYTTVAGAKAAVEGIVALHGGALDVAPLQSYFKTAF